MSATNLRIATHEAREHRQDMAERARAIRDLIDRACRLAETLDAGNEASRTHRDGMLSDLSNADFEATLYAEEMER